MSGHQEMPAYDDNSVFSDLTGWAEGPENKNWKTITFLYKPPGAIIGHIIGQQ